MTRVTPLNSGGDGSDGCHSDGTEDGAMRDKSRSSLHRGPVGLGARRGNSNRNSMLTGVSQPPLIEKMSSFWGARSQRSLSFIGAPEVGDTSPTTTGLGLSVLSPLHHSNLQNRLVRQSSSVLARHGSSTLDSERQPSSLSGNENSLPPTVSDTGPHRGRDEGSKSVTFEDSRRKTAHIAPGQADGLRRSVTGPFRHSLVESGGDGVRLMTHTSAHLNGNVDNKSSRGSLRQSFLGNYLERYGNFVASIRHGSAILRRETSTVDWEAFGPRASSNKPKYIFLPDGIERRIWDSIVACSLVYVALVVPPVISFNIELTGFFLVIDFMVSLVFGLDIILNCFTAKLDRTTGELLVTVEAIMYSYLNSWMIADILAAAPLYWFYLIVADPDDEIERACRLMGIVKLLRVFRMQSIMVKIENRLNLHPGISRLAHITITVILVTHLVGCLWHYMASFHDGTFEPHGWVIHHNLEDTQSHDRYVTSIYWAFSTLTTVGYGDIVAHTNVEKQFSIFIMILGVTWYAYVVSFMSDIMQSFNGHSALIAEKFNELNQFIRDAKLPPALSDRIRAYFEYRLSKKETFDYRADEILAQMNSSLRCETVLYVDRGLISKINFFKGKDPMLICAVVVCLKPCLWSAEEHIVVQDTKSDEMFFLTKGTVAIYKGSGKVYEVEQGGYFGEIGIILGIPRPASAIASTPIEAYVLRKDTVTTVMQEWPEVAEEWREVSRTRMRKIAQIDLLGLSKKPTPWENQKRSSVRSSKYHLWDIYRQTSHIHTVLAQIQRSSLTQKDIDRENSLRSAAGGSGVNERRKSFRRPSLAPSVATVDEINELESEGGDLVDIEEATPTLGRSAAKPWRNSCVAPSEKSSSHSLAPPPGRIHRSSCSTADIKHVVGGEERSTLGAESTSFSNSGWKSATTPDGYCSEEIMSSEGSEGLFRTEREEGEGLVGDTEEATLIKPVDSETREARPRDDPANETKLGPSAMQNDASKLPVDVEAKKTSPARFHEGLSGEASEGSSDQREVSHLSGSDKNFVDELLYKSELPSQT